MLSASAFGPALAARSDVGQVIDTVSNVVIAVLTPLLFGLFPDGRWHPRWFRWAWIVPAAVSTASLAGSALVSPAFADSDAVGLAELVSWLGLVAVQVHRYRRHSDCAARQQTKVLLTVVFLVTNLLLVNLSVAAGLITAYQPVAVLLTYATTGVLDVGMLVALFRFRLYGADVALRRTAVYSAAGAGRRARWRRPHRTG